MNRKVHTVLALTIGTLLAGCGPVDTGPFTEVEVCRAGIATTMLKPLSIVKYDGSEPNVHYLHYIRQSDGTRWEFRCKLEGNNIVWATDTGPWRKRTYDSDIKFRVTGSDLVITETYYDGSSQRKEYSK